MTTSPISAGITAQNMAQMRSAAAITPEDNATTAAFEAALNGVLPPDTGDELPSSPTDGTDTPSDADLWESFRKEVNNQAFQHTNHVLAYYEQKRKELDYGNK